MIYRIKLSARINQAEGMQQERKNFSVEIRHFARCIQAFPITPGMVFVNWIGRSSGLPSFLSAAFPQASACSGVGADLSGLQQRGLRRSGRQGACLQKQQAACRCHRTSRFIAPQGFMAQNQSRADIISEKNSQCQRKARHDLQAYPSTCFFSCCSGQAGCAVFLCF